MHDSKHDEGSKSIREEEQGLGKEVAVHGQPDARRGSRQRENWGEVIGKKDSFRRLKLLL